jgi:S-adenosylmethionine hydrolase
MGRRYDTVSVLTDYGTTDEFVGVMKAVLRDLAPHVVAIDLTHEIPAFDVRAGALALARAAGYLPEGVVVAVVDPGVGTDRRAVAIEVAGGAGVFVGPDNGLLAPAVAMTGGAERAVLLSNPQYRLEAPGATFDGRDVFMPAAAHLCNGVELTELGELVDPLTLLPGSVPLSRTESGRIIGEVLWIDRYGNCQLNIDPDEVAELIVDDDPVRVVLADGSARVAARTTNFADVATGAVGLVVDSYGMLALACDRRSAAEELRVGPGDQITLEPVSDGERVQPSAPISQPVSLRSTDVATGEGRS